MAWPILPMTVSSPRFPWAIHRRQRAGPGRDWAWIARQWTQRCVALALQVQITLRGFTLLKSLRVRKYRAFQDFTLAFQGGAYIMGPNNAGKTSLLTALRLSQTLLRHAWNRRASEIREHNGVTVRGYPANLREYPALSESVRHEFGEEETTIELKWVSGATMTVVWPNETTEDPSPYFYLRRPDGYPIESPASVKKYFERLGIIPPLGPVDHEEKILDDTYVRSNVESRLASRHFRNQLNMLLAQNEWISFTEWATEWLGGLTIETPITRGGELDVFYHEPGSRIPKELIWAGDGIQVWLQILYHVFRNRECATLVLDEPEVFLHPDLQRRLVALLESTGHQVVMATHSAEVAAEVDPAMVALVDRSTKRASRAKTDDQLELLTQSIGSSFNLRLAKALRATGVIFVEGQDMRVLRTFARTLGLKTLATESGLAIIQLGGFASWDHLPAFAWLTKDLLPGAVELSVILDRDYHSDEEVAKAEASLVGAKIHAHVWKRKELESYLITPSVISRLSGASESKVSDFLDVAAEEQRYQVSSQLAAHARRASNSSVDLATLLAPIQREFDAAWVDPQYRLARTNAKQLLSCLNRLLTGAGHKSVSTYRLALEHHAGEIPTEMKEVLIGINGPIDG
jgi:AAA domain, putative AbiEii toxin, Type IV TA system